MLPHLFFSTRSFAKSLAAWSNVTDEPQTRAYPVNAPQEPALAWQAKATVPRLSNLS
jgi:hypothetical protein